ncbi:hypothetical protein EAH79_13695 [Sphingomonas koreensis]|nr:hypothetical protein EAH79_13695 [Sphingomonas koreensis]
MTNQKAGGLIDGLRVRHDGWTAARQRIFLRALSETGCVRDACARAGISNTSAYRMKKRSAPFARAWDRAIAKAMPTIEQAAYERAVIGWDEPIVQGGKVVGSKRRYSDSLLRLLLQRQSAPSGPAVAEAPPPSQALLDAAATVAAAAAGGLFASAAALTGAGDDPAAALTTLVTRHVDDWLRDDDPPPPAKPAAVQAALDAAGLAAATAAGGRYASHAELEREYDEEAAAKAEVMRLLDLLAADDADVDPADAPAG